MNPVFISYSKEEPAPTLSLAKALEDLGYSVWWDVTLAPGDDFAEVIQSKLRSCAAAIVIWSTAAARSRWVRAEAQIADRYSKLIPVRVEGFDPQDIPPPYNILHTDLATNIPMIVSKLTSMGIVPSLGLKSAAMVERAASTSELEAAKPVDTSQDRLASAVRLNVLTWVSIVGATTLTLFSNLGSFFQLAAWARYLEQNWHSVVTGLWPAVFGWTGLTAPPLVERGATVGLVIGALALLAWIDQRRFNRVPAYLLWIPEAWSARTRATIRGFLLVAPLVFIVVVLNAAFHSSYWAFEPWSNFVLAAYRLVLDPLSQFAPVLIAALFVRIEYLSARAWQAAIAIMTIFAMSRLAMTFTSPYW